MPKLIVRQTEIRKAFRHLSVQEANTRLYEELMAQPDNLITEIHAEARCIMAVGYRLLRIDSRDGPDQDTFEIALVNDVIKAVAYYNKVVVAPLIDLHCRPATQNLVWRSTDAQHAPVLRDVAQNVFFNYVLEHYDVILSDNHHTGEGKHFWQRQMSLALAYDMHVYYYQMLTATLTAIPDQAALSALEDELWGTDDAQEYHLALISKVELPVENQLEISLEAAEPDAS